MIQLFNKILFGHKKEWSTDICYCSVTKSCPTLCDSMDCSTPGFPVLHYLPEFAQTHVHWVRMPSKDLFLCCPLLLLPSIFCSIRVFSSESVFHIRWPKYWAFTSSISPSNEYSGLISFRIDWFDVLAVKGTLKNLLHHHSSKASILQCSAFFMVQLSHLYMTTGKTSSFDNTDSTISLTIQTIVARWYLSFLIHCLGLS